MPAQFPQTTDAIREIRAIRRLTEQVRYRQGTLTAALTIDAVIARLNRLEVDLAPQAIDDFVTNVVVVSTTGESVCYDTVLGFLAKNDALMLLDMADPVYETNWIGRACAQHCRAKGIPVARVPAAANITVRYPDVTHVNAYPVEVIDMVVSKGRGNA